MYMAYIRHFNKKITIHAVIYSADSQFWPPLRTSPHPTCVHTPGMKHYMITCTHIRYQTEHTHTPSTKHFTYAQQV